MRNDFLQVETEKLLDTEKPQRTSRHRMYLNGWVANQLVGYQIPAWKQFHLLYSKN